MEKFDAIMFDLDGTLWETKESYLYAYHQVIKNHPEIKNIHNDEYIINTMGLTLTEVGKAVYDDENNVENLLMESLACSVNYLLNNESTILDSTIEVLKELSKKYLLFVVSNCPKLYIDAFKVKLGCDTIFKDYKYLQDGSSKEQNILALMKQYNLENPLYVGDNIRDFTSSHDLNLSFAYYSKGYKKCDKYNYYLNSFHDLLNVVAFNEYKYNILKGKRFINFYHNDAQLTYMERDGYHLFGFMKLSHNHDFNLQLFAKFHAYLDANHITKVIGPIDYSTWFNYRLAVDNFNIKFLPDCNNDVYAVNLLEQLGYVTNQDYDSTISTVNERLHKMLKRIKLDNNLVIKTYQDNECFDHIDEIYEVSKEAFVGHYLYSDISHDDFKALYVGNFKIPHPDLIVIYDKSSKGLYTEEEPIAFSLCYEDPKNLLYVSKTVAIKPKYQNGKVLSKIIDVNYDLMKNTPYDKVLYHFRNTRNTLFKQVTKHNKVLSKRYKLFERVTK